MERDYKGGTLWLLLAWNRHLAGDASGAERCLTEVLQWWEGKTLERLSDWQEEAAVFLLTPLGSLPNAPKVAVQTLRDGGRKALAPRWAQAGAFAQALELAQQIEEASSRSEALAGIAQALAQTGQREQAPQVLQEALQAAQQIEGAADRSEALRGIAQALAQAGAYEQAVQAAQQIEEAAVRSLALSGIAQALAQAGQREQAQRTLQEAWTAARTASQFSALWQVAQTAAQAGFYDLAVDYAQQIAGNRSEGLPGVLDALTERGAKGAFLALLPLCAWERTTALRACAGLIWLYPEQAAAIANQVLAGA